LFSSRFGFVQGDDVLHGLDELDHVDELLHETNGGTEIKGIERKRVGVEMNKIKHKPESLISGDHESQEVLVAVVELEEAEVVGLDDLVAGAAPDERAVEAGVVADEIQGTDEEESVHIHPLMVKL